MNVRIAAAALVLASLSLTAVADTGADSDAVASGAASAVITDTSAAITRKIRSVRPDLQVVSVEPSPLPGIYQAQILNGPMIYVSSDGNYFIVGDLYQVGGKQLVNMTERQRNQHRAKLLSAVDPSEMIVFAPADPSAVRATLTVFTDVDCPYCQRLHQDIPELNRMGIEVRYLAFPRNGIGSPAYTKMVSAWCADDPKAAFDKLEKRGSVPSRNCDDQPVDKSYALGQKLDVRGTPSLVFADGSMWPGYLSPEQLAKRLDLQ